jgi:hypothetical protein
MGIFYNLFLFKKGDWMMNMRREILFLSSFFCIAILNAAYRESSLKTVDDIPAYCTTLAEKLAQMPVNNCNHVRSLYVGNTSDYNVLVSLNNSARGLRPDVWSIKGHALAYLEGRLLVITLAEDNCVRCSLQDLKQTYGDVVACLKKGWMEDNSLGTAIKIEEGCRLFMKKRQLIKEDKLIGCLISKFGLDGCARCSDYLLKEDGGYYELTDVVYLLIKDEAFDTVQQIFGFQISTK